LQPISLSPTCIKKSTHSKLNSRTISDSEIRIKNSIKIMERDASQQTTELQNSQKTQSHQLKEICSKLQSFKDSQHNINNTTKKQIQTLSTTRHTHHSSSQTDIDTEPLTEQHTQMEYNINTSNRYALLTDRTMTDTSSHSVHTHKQTNENNSPTSHKHTSKQPLLTNTLHHTHPHPSALSHLSTRCHTRLGLIFVGGHLGEWKGGCSPGGFVNGKWSVCFGEDGRSVDVYDGMCL